MTDVPSPPDSVDASGSAAALPPPPSVTPPPPPPSLTAPPGSAAFTSAPMQPVALQRVGKLSTAVVALTTVAAVVSIATIWASQAAQTDARDLLDGTITDAQFVERAAPYLLMTTVQAVATLATAVLTMIWMFRLAKNHRTLHRATTWGPGWAIGGWFLPPLLFVIPFLMFRELWKASNPESPVGAEWKSGPVSPIVPIWFVLYSLVPIGLLILQTSSGLSLGASERDLAQQVIDDEVITVVGAIVAVAGAIAFVLLVRGLTARHQELTGELAAGA